MKKMILAAMLVPSFAFATSPPPPPYYTGQTTLQLDATAKSQVANDEMVVNLAADRSGTTVGPLNDAVLSALNSAIAQAKAIPGINARLGSVSTNQNWENGKQSGWRVRGEVVLTSKDMKALAILAGKLGDSLQLNGISFRLSDERRTAEEKRLLAEAAANFQEKAGAATKAFGFGTYTLKDVSVNQSGYVPTPRPVVMMAMAKAASAPVPAEGGESEVAVTVSGSVVLTK